MHGRFINLRIENSAQPDESTQSFQPTLLHLLITRQPPQALKIHGDHADASYGSATRLHNRQDLAVTFHNSHPLALLFRRYP
jgi:hypothetical protein